MSNDFYNHGGYPAQSSLGVSLTAREEFDAIAAGFEKMPDLVSLFFVRTNSAGTALETLSPQAARVAITAAGIAAENTFSVPQIFSDTLCIGRGTIPADTMVLIDNLGTGTIPTLPAATALTLAGCASAGSGVYLQLISGNASRTDIRFGDTDAAYRGYIGYEHTTDSMLFGTAGTVAIKIKNDDYVLMGTTETVYVGTTTHEGFSYSVDDALSISRSSATPFYLQRTTDNGDIAGFFRQTTLVGSISVTAVATSYNTSSDYRLKPNWSEINNSGSFIDALIPRCGNWLIDNSYGAGFYAHELQEISPSSVTGIKDAIDENQNPIHQSVSYASSEIIANMVAELKSLRKRVALLEGMGN